MTTTLTRELLLEKAKLAYEEVDVPGFGVVGIRQRSELKRMQRINQMFDGTGAVIESHNDRRRAYMIIDQVMVDERTPLFESDDIDAVMDMASNKLDPIVVAITAFNERVDPEKKDEGGLDDSSES